MSTREETIERLREQAAAENDEPELPLEPEPVEEDDDKPSAIREYIVFIKTGSETWKEHARINAGSRESAVKALGDRLSEGAEYAVCPARNWSVGTPEIATTTSVRIAFK